MAGGRFLVAFSDVLWYHNRVIIISLGGAAMYLEAKIKIPSGIAGITTKTIKGVTYVYYIYSRSYDADKKYTAPKATSIGKCVPEEPGMMYPNHNFLRFFPEIDLPDEKSETYRSGCLRIGAYAVLSRIVAEYHLDEMADRIIGEDSGLFLDLAIYSIISENNAGQYYPEYAYNHPLFTDEMRMYSDTKVSNFLGSIKQDQRIQFLNEWNEKMDHRQKIYISYDSTNKDCQAGEIELAEYGHPKVNTGQPVIGYSIAYDCNNTVPLFYEDYPGSIVDVTQLQIMLEKAHGYGYRHIGFILDRGYFSQANIRYMDKHGYDFVIMVKGMGSLVRQLVLSVRGTFEDKRECSIRGHRVNGITVPGRLFPSDEKDRYFHIYYNDGKKAGERERLESRIDQMAAVLRKCERKKLPPLNRTYEKYFKLVYMNKGKKDEKFMYAEENTEVINQDIQLCGYFVLVTSDKMTAQEALDLYRSRDASEKLFRGDKSYLGNSAIRNYTTEPCQAKIFLEFVALIIRNRFYTYLKSMVKNTGRKRNYFTVPAAIRELEKIEIIQQTDRNYRLGRAVTATQKDILKAFNMTAANIKEEAIAINDELIQIAARRLQHGSQNNND